MSAVVVYITATGQPVSFASDQSLVVSPLPVGMSSQTLTAPEYDGIRNGTMKWDAATRTVIPMPPDPIVVNTGTINGKLQTAIAANTTALANVATAKANVQTNVNAAAAANVTACKAQINILGTVLQQVIDQIDRVERQLTGIEKLILAGDNLLDTTGT